MGILNHATVGGTSYNVGDYASLDALCGVDYGWQNGVQTATVASVAVTRNGNRITLNGTNTQYAYIRMNGSLVGVANGEPTAAQNIAGFTGVSGHKYVIRARLVSGSISYDAVPTYSVGVSCRKAGTTNSYTTYTLQKIYTEGWFTRWFTSGGEGAAVWLYVPQSTYTNAEFEIVIMDETAAEQLDQRVRDMDERLSGGYPVDWYGPDGTLTFGGLSVSYIGGIARLNGTYYSNGASTMWGVSNGVTKYGGSVNDSFINPTAVLKAGHTYKISAIILSGTVTGTSTSKPAMRYYTRVGTGSVVATEFTTDLISTTTSATYPIVFDKYMTPASDTQIGFGFWTRSPSQATAETYNDLTVVFRVEDISTTGTATQNLAAADTLTATSSHASGSLLTVGGRLYKATAAIAAGETIVSGSGGNVTATSIATELTARDTAIAANGAAATAAAEIGSMGFNQNAYGADYTTTSSGLTVTKAGTVFTLGGTLSSTYTVAFNNGLKVGAGATSYLNANAKLAAGRTYRIYAVVNSGSLTDSSSGKPYFVLLHAAAGASSLSYTTLYCGNTDTISTAMSASSARPLWFSTAYTPKVDETFAFGMVGKASFTSLNVSFYVQDITLLAQVAAIATSEKPVATASHATGDLLMLGGRLYKATASISAGADIVTSGTGANVESTTVAAELAALSARITALGG